MKKKIIAIFAIIIAIGAFVANQLITYARVADPSLFAGLTKTVTYKIDEDEYGEEEEKQVGYGNGNPNPTGGSSDKGEYIWNIKTYDSTNSEDVSPTQRNLYCVKADYGNKWFTLNQIDEIIEYQLYYDMQTDVTDLLSNLQEDDDNTVEELLNPLGNQYNRLLWIFDHSYVPGVTNLDDYLAQFGILKDEKQNMYYKKDKFYGKDVLTDYDIIAIQRMAIWYFTNGTAYDETGSDAWLNITSDGTNYAGLDTVSLSRNSMAVDVYKSLISQAIDGAEQYKTQNILSTPISVNGISTDMVNSVVTTRIGENYLIGPIIIQENNDLWYNIAITVEDQNQDILTEKEDFTFTDKDGIEIAKTSQKDLVGIEDGFYISVPREKIESANIKITASYKETTKKLWLAGEEDVNDGKVTLSSEQPLVEITQEPQTLTVQLTANPEEFDLALRKYITALHDKNGNVKTIPNARETDNISLNSLTTGTTATYNHRKDPVVVEDKDEVTYEIRIYNEGNKAGYAKQIIDQLPTGLVGSTNNPRTVESKDKEGNVKNKYQLDYNSSNNQIILTLIQWPEELEQELEQGEDYVKDLEPYKIGNLDYETIEFKCMVAQEPDTIEQIVLTNVAWIESAWDSEDEVEISSEGTLDRDSEPQDSPKLDVDDMADYRGITTETESILANEDFFFKGQEDDDDFEKLVIMPVEKKFDLALVKFIAAISDDQVIEENEYLKEDDGTYSRAPEVKIDAVTGKIIYDFEQRGAKNPLTVKPGDYVLYTIRVYNEGELDGYASKIKDSLPIGLEFVYENLEYNGIWNFDGKDLDGRDVFSTTYFAEGQGAEENEENYKANLLKAFKKDVAISKQNPDYLDAQVLCRVVEQETSNRVLVNYAEIAEDSDENGNPVLDIDSTPNKWVDTDDDQDIERIKLQYFDLSLRKFISSINGNAPSVSREPVVNKSNLVNKAGTTAVYNHPKTPLAVEIGDKVIYTIRVYNEGDINGFASEVKDYLPPYLEYVEDSEINKQYGWQANGRVVTTKYLETRELKAFDGTNLDYADLKIECIVSKSAPLKQNQTNIAEISEYKYNGTTVSKDIDSYSNNMVSKNYMPADEELPTYKDEEINKEYVPGNEDDDDFEKVYVKYLDFSLRKYVNKVNGEELAESREPVVDVTPLQKGEGTTAIYKHSKLPVALKIGDIVTYTIRVYNEGEASGYANEVKDYLPPYLDYVKDSKINSEYGWNISEDGRIATTKYLSNKEISGFNGKTLDYEDLQIECKVSSKAILHENITNIAEISEYKYGETILPKDIDSESNNIDEDLPADEQLPSYKDEEINKEYVPGNEDDDDFEKVYVKEFDLALRKFITQIQDKEVTTRVPEVKIENGAITYVHPKDALIVHVGDIVTYTLGIYNEGETSGYASEITDDIPEFLEYLPENSTNVEFMWEMYDENGAITENVEDAVKVKTEYLSKENNEDNLLKEFDGETLSYKDIKIAFKVKDPNSNTYIITNYAQISNDTDENGKEVNDKDSIPDEWHEGEDDQDIENVKVEYFDLSLLKFVSKVIVIEDGKEKITETGYNGHENPEPVVKVELHKKKLDKVVVKFVYGLTITNEGDIPGYATEITDYVPEGLKFDKTDNPDWIDEGNNVISTKKIENKLLQPGESTTIEVTLTWINGADNLSTKTNFAEISEDKNEYDIPDRDSTPDDKQEEYDDIDNAEIILNISTGNAKTYFTLILGLLAVVAAGVVLIKKFVI